MATTTERSYVRTALHPVHAVLLAAILPCFLGALLSDLAYGSSYELQWANFASWLIVGGLVFGGLALLWAIVGLLRADVRRDRRRGLYVLALLGAWIVGFVNALVHAKDGWARMPDATILSLIALLLALLAIWLGFPSLRAGDMK
ncbi:hypothetical protein IC614_00505 [Allosphingosinicella flava]|uniref:DUF2231 domain-containing protein n=1 Tax=Allosphingosinicella flava TaxID=2771430 RepID=A0A7T2GJQ2_9SPHN|nr:DUF2231 domain-containing protein [Sphingosinicella flava]QPQ55141.1 hypothetical protein IC614_00505 [Sphingosinicella flava]